MRKTLALISVILCLLSSTKCAKRGVPTGGAKDSIPPVLLSANPPLKSVNFAAERVVMVFDEYVQLRELANQLIVSPPLESNTYKVLPEGTVSKKVEIRFEEAPRDNTTYTFNFGGAIQDYNEANPLPFFNYTFSTGAFLDSLRISGNVMDAYEIDSLKGISIHLYPIDSTYTDSTIYLNKPLYVGNTLDSIYFNLQSLAPGEYEFLAIEDVGKNYLYDQGFDKIGFFDKPIRLPEDSLKFPFLFKEKARFRWGRPRFVNDHHLEFGYFGEVGEKQVFFDSLFSEKAEGFFTRDREKDTLHYWFQPQEELDSLVIELEELDTIRKLVLKPYKLVKDSLLLSITPKKNRIIHFLDTLTLESNLPIREIDEEFIQIFDIDTLALEFSTRLDENKDRVYFSFEKVPNDFYRVQLLPNAITDFLGATNDTIMHSVKTQDIEKYGTLFLTIERKDPSIPYFFEIIDRNEKVVRKVRQNNDDYYVIEYLLPNDYQIRFVKDTNNNGKWDTGNYLNKRQPEQVIYLKQSLSLRANWDLNETLTIE